MKEILTSLQESERNYAVDRIRVNGRSFWPFFRSLLYARLLKGLLLVHPKRLKDALNKIRNAPMGWWNWLRHFDYVFLSNEMERKLLVDHYIDKIAEGAIGILGYDKSLYIEQVRERHLKRQEYGERRVSSNDFVLLIAMAYKFFGRTGLKAKVENIEVWYEIAGHFSISTAYKDELDTFLAKVYAFKVIFRWVRPKVLFVNDYGHLAAIFAARELGILVVEFQHGVIGKVHPYYHPVAKLDRQFRPDYLLAFGINDVEGLAHGNYVDRERIFPIGNYYLSKLVNRPLNDAVLAVIGSFRTSIGVPTDHTNHGYLLDFVCNVSHDFPDHIFLVLPRVAALADLDKTLPSNVRIILEFSFQETIRHCDFNTSTNSTCCLEAPTLGARNILVDEDGLASQYFGEILTDPAITRFARDEGEYREALRTMGKIDRNRVQASNSGNYMSDHDHCLRDALAAIHRGDSRQ